MIFVTGGTGYTGRWVLAELLKRGQTVKCLVRKNSDTTGLTHAALDFVTGDLENDSGWWDALAGVNAVISVAHIKYAPFIIQACKIHRISRVVFFSSTWRFSKFKTSVVESVIQGEEAIEASGLDYTILRPTMIFGPGNDRNITRLRSMMTRVPIMPIFGAGQRLVQPVYVEDVAQAAVDVAFCNEAIGKGFELAGAEALTYNDMIDTVAGELGRTVIKVHIPISLGLLLAFLGKRIWSKFPIQDEQIRRMTEDRAFDISLAKRVWGFAPLDFKTGLKVARKQTGVSVQ